MARIIMHIDLNAFFAAAEVLRHPEYKGKPIAVGGGNRRGVISTASYEARKYGVHSAMPSYMAKRLCPSLVILPPDFAYYKDLSNRFFQYIRKNYSTIIEPLSIDECFVDMTDALKDVKDVKGYLKKLQNGLLKEIGIGCSIGISTTKFLAKMGSDYKKPMGIVIIRKKDIPTLLYPLPISSFYGIGKKSTEKLKRMGIYTIGDFAESDSLSVKKELGKSYALFKDWIHGKGNDTVICEESNPKSISSSSTFLFDTSSYEEISSSFHELAKEVSESLIKKEMVALTVQITLRDMEFHTITRSKTLAFPIESTLDIYSQGMSLFEKHWKGNALRLIGIGVSSLHSKENYSVQLSLFDSLPELDSSTRYLIEKLNKKANKEVFMIAKDLVKKKGGKNGT